MKKYNPSNKHKILIVSDEMIVDMLSNKKLNAIVTELFIGGRNLKIYFFISQFYFSVPKKMLV